MTVVSLVVTTPIETSSADTSTKNEIGGRSSNPRRIHRTARPQAQVPYGGVLVDGLILGVLVLAVMRPLIVYPTLTVFGYARNEALFGSLASVTRTRSSASWIRSRLFA